MKPARIVITGVGLTAPNGNSLSEFRRNLLDGVAGIERMEIRYMGSQLAGVCHFDPLKYQKKRRCGWEPVPGASPFTARGKP